MSFVTNVIVTLQLGEDRAAMAGLNGALAERFKAGLTLVDNRSVGGDKNLEAAVWIGAFNALMVEDMIEMMQAQTWQYPLSVRCFMQRQNEDAFEERLWGER